MSNNKNNLNKAMFDMFGVGKAPEQEKKAEAAPVKAEAAAPATYIAAGVSIEGNIKAKGDVEIAGELKGDISSEGGVIVRSNIVGNINAGTLKLIDCCVTGDINANGDIVITDSSIVNGNVKGKSLSCSGKINGDVVLAVTLSLDSSACIIGKITTGSMIVARGAVIKGSLEMRANE